MNALKKRLLFNLIYFCAWIGYFVISRMWFLIYYADQTSKLDSVTILKTFLQGLKLDASFSGYLVLIPFLIITFSIWLPQKNIKIALKVFTFPIVFFVNFLMLVDLALYGSWGMRLDSTPLMYINTPKEMLASVTFGNLILAILVWIISSFVYAYFFGKLINYYTKGFEKGKIWHFPVLLFTTASLILVFRGGLQTIPINQSNVYFSKKMFANHAAVNFAWNFFQSVSHKGYVKENHFLEVEKNMADAIFMQNKETIRLKPTTSVNEPILKTTQPNVILIIWESLTAKVVEPLGGVPHVTENFNKLCREGILFTNFYANGDRSDKGMVAIFSGYYPQPNNSIIKMPNKSESLPMLTKKMKDLGYTSSFYYGGDMNFGNMNTYMVNGEVDQIIDGGAFEKKDWNSKWGVHDHVLFNRFSSDLSGQQSEPFFKTIFTLSSHEPFEFPAEYKFGKNSEVNKFLSSHAYTDAILGEFIKKAKEQPWWDNTLVVIMADHGHPLPNHEGTFNDPKRFHIPMLWLGGALNKTNDLNTTFSSQTDFAYTLLALLNGDNSEFEWGNNFFQESPNHFAHYIFNKGFGTIDSKGYFVYDYVGKKTIVKKGKSSKKLEMLGKVITQKAYQDFIER